MILIAKNGRTVRALDTDDKSLSWLELLPENVASRLICNLDMISALGRTAKSIKACDVPDSQITGDCVQ